MSYRAAHTLCLPLFLAAAAATASAQDPEFRGPPIYEGAWETTADWGDPAAGPNDRSQGSFAYHYRVWAAERADQHVEQRTKLDCADLSIALLCEFAAKNGLPLSWRVYYPAERRFVTFQNTDAQFASPEAFQRWSQHFLGAMNLADNTYAVTYDDWAGGDMVLMDWNQSDESPNFEGREVWHTYLIGVPDEVIYYGNINDGEPLPVTRVSGGSRMSMVRDHPDRYGLSPRRYRLLQGKVWGPVQETATVIRVSRALNLRAGPGTSHGVLATAERGASFEVLGRDGQWVQLQLADGREAWAHGYYLQVEAAEAASGAAGALAALE